MFSDLVSNGAVFLAVGPGRRSGLSACSQRVTVVDAINSCRGLLLFDVAFLCVWPLVLDASWIVCTGRFDFTARTISQFGRDFMRSAGCAATVGKQKRRNRADDYHRKNREFLPFAYRPRETQDRRFYA